MDTEYTAIQKNLHQCHLRNKCLLHSFIISNLIFFLFFLRLEGNAEANTLILMISEIISQLQHYMPQNCCRSDDLINSVLTER